MSFKSKAYAATTPDQPLAEFAISRRSAGSTDVVIDIKYCGVCHSDIHQARNEWSNTTYPCVPGHEIVGHVSEIGDQVKNFKIGDSAAVGCLVDSCRACSACEENLEQHCEAGPIFSYNSDDRQTGGVTFGGYSQKIVVDQDFVLKVPENLNLAAAAPLLCAGITTYSPLKRFNVGPGQIVGVLGLGGLGHMGVKLAKAMGAKVIVLTRSSNKIEDAKRLGADEVLLTTDTEAMNQNSMRFDLILDTVSADHDIDSYMDLLKRSGQMVLVGAPEKPQQISAFSLIFQRRHISGSLIGGIKETQEMLDYCGKHNIVSDIELISMNQINTAFERILASDVKYRFVIDMSTL